MPDPGFDPFMTGADALMWTIEQDPLLRSTIVAAVYLDGTPDWETVRAKLAQGSRHVARMRQCVVEPALGVGAPAWSDDRDFDLDYHVRRVGNPDPTSDRVVLDLAATAAMRAFDRDRPLWEYVFVDGLPGGRSAFILKFHHAMTDGVGGVELLPMILDLAPEPTPLPETMPPEPPHFTATAVARHRLGDRLASVPRAARGLPTVTRSVVDALRADPVATLVGAGVTVASAARFLAPAPSPVSPVLDARSLGRRVFTVDIPLDDLKGVARRLGSSLNDVFVGAVGEAVRRYHAARNVDTPDLRMIMPINLRGGGSGLGGNHFTPARIMIPTSEADPVIRIEEFGRRARELRAEPAVALTEQLAAALALLPRRVATTFMGSMFKGADLVVSNVPGAPFPLYLGGTTVERMYAFGPPTGTACNVTLLSHDGTCCIGVCVDTAAVSDPAELEAHLRDAIAEVVGLA